MHINREGDYYELTDGDATIYINENSRICQAEVYSEISDEFYYDIKAFLTVAGGDPNPSCLQSFLTCKASQSVRQSVED